MNTCLIVSTYTPRKCGIATFSKDLRDNLLSQGQKVLMAAISDPFTSYVYSPEVAFNIRQERRSDYVSCAKWANNNPDIEIVIIQHEYGIFGGQDGDYVLDLVAHLQKPYLLVTHTVLPRPYEHQKKVLRKLTQSAGGVICMTTRARKLLLNIYSVPEEKISVVPHGVPNFPVKEREFLKAQYGLQDHRIVTTFGFIGPGKGLEFGLQALAMVINRYPDALYLIAGNTHPMLLRSEGERYRNSLLKLVKELHLDNNVLFVNRFLDIDELGDYLYMTDVYLSPYPNLDQAVSGPLSFAVGCGRAIVSTPYEYAREILAEGRGLTACDATPKAMAELLDLILGDPAIQARLEKMAAELGQSFNWERVAGIYLKIAEEVMELYDARDVHKLGL
ncbi:MAG: glycosyltransferase family 4 protein [Syntrophomonadaceae bacterium]|nr:glycosyltransferase family 4 protein [Syntrophomonadaceae bacterium]MDD3889668.1 glycosyltransferase family 4 protein [Syntrophomonadaceae bacterium]MDD4548697.1 glycosyltransferase family 4 protein [Syntrophomonadaceae bacterium]